MVKKKSSKKTTKKVVRPNKPSEIEIKTADAALRWKIAFFIALVAVAILAIDEIIDNSGTTTKTKDVEVDLAGAEIVVEEYSDFQCPYCARFYTGAYQDMKNDPLYQEGKIKFVFKHFPLSIHKDAQKASEASECARDQGMFIEYHDMLFENQNALTVPDLKTYAGRLGLDQSEFDNCLDSGAKEAIVLADFNEGRAKGVSGTPTIYVNGQQFVGAQAWTTLKAAATNNAPDTTNTGTQNAAADPEFDVIVLNDQNCAVCDGSAIEAGLSGSFPTATFKQLDISSTEGKEVSENINVAFVPAVVFDTSVEKTSNFAQLSQALIQQGDYYVLNPQIQGYPTFKLLEVPAFGENAVKGDENAPITIYEWSDFECPYCARFYTDTYETLVEEYVDTGKVKIVFMHFPLSFHPQAKPAALASECANDQGMFWEYHDVLFENQASLNADNYVKWAVELGMDETVFKECYNSGKHNALIDQEFQQGQQNYITGTPGFLINGIKLSGAQPIDVFRQIIDSELAS